MNIFTNRQLYFRCISIIFLLTLGLPVLGQSPPIATTGVASGIGTTDAILKWNFTVKAVATNTNNNRDGAFFSLFPDGFYHLRKNNPWEPPLPLGKILI